LDINGRQTTGDGMTQDTGSFEFDASSSSRARGINFTFRWDDTQKQVREDFMLPSDD
jgi:hypothetical protein